MPASLKKRPRREVTGFFAINRCTPLTGFGFSRPCTLNHFGLHEQQVFQFKGQGLARNQRAHAFGCSCQHHSAGQQSIARSGAPATHNGAGDRERRACAPPGQRRGFLRAPPRIDPVGEWVEVAEGGRPLRAAGYPSDWNFWPLRCVATNNEATRVG